MYVNGSYNTWRIQEAYYPLLLCCPDNKKVLSLNFWFMYCHLFFVACALPNDESGPFYFYWKYDRLSLLICCPDWLIPFVYPLVLKLFYIDQLLFLILMYTNHQPQNNISSINIMTLPSLLYIRDNVTTNKLILLLMSATISGTYRDSWVKFNLCSWTLRKTYFRVINSHTLALFNSQHQQCVSH